MKINAPVQSLSGSHALPVNVESVSRNLFISFLFIEEKFEKSVVIKVEVDRITTG